MRIKNTIIFELILLMKKIIVAVKIHFKFYSVEESKQNTLR